MNARYTVAALLLTAMATTASGSVLSASNATGHARAQSADDFSVTAVQNEMNASLAEKADAAAPGSFTDSAPALGANGGFLVTTGAGVGSGNTTMFSSNSSFEGRSFGGGGGGFLDWDRDRGDSQSGFRPDRRGHRPDGGGRRFGGGRRGGGGTHATPEPSTWMLLGTGLMTMGLYAGMRCRQSLSM